MNQSSLSGERSPGSLLSVAGALDGFLCCRFLRNIDSESLMVSGSLL